MHRLKTVMSVNSNYVPHIFRLRVPAEPQTYGDLFSSVFSETAWKQGRGSQRTYRGKGRKAQKKKSNLGILGHPKASDRSSQRPHCFPCSTKLHLYPEPHQTHHLLARPLRLLIIRDTKCLEILRPISSRRKTRFFLPLSIFPALNFCLEVQHISGQILTFSVSHQPLTSPSGASLHRKASE